MADNPVIGRELIRLKNLIVSHFRESQWLELATLLNEFEYVERHPRLLRSYRFSDDDYEGHVLTVLRTLVERDPENLSLIANYVQSVSPEDGEYVSSHQSAARRIVFAPEVFTIHDEVVDCNLVAVMMPFKGFGDVYEAIKHAVSDTGMTPERADNVWEHTVLVQDIFSLIFRSYIVVCDFSGKNPNVFYEAGIAHTLGRHVVPITQSKDDIPFDLQHHRYLLYLNNSEGRAELTSQLSSRITTLASRRPLR